MLRQFATVAAFACMACHSLAQAQAQAPSSPAPRLAVAQMSSDDTVDVTEIVERFAIQQVSREVEVDGVLRVITEAVQVPVFEKRILRARISDIQMTNIAGDRIDRELARRLFERETPVLLSDKTPVEPVFAAVLKPNTIVLVFSANSVSANAEQVRDVDLERDDTPENEITASPERVENQLDEARALQTIERLTPHAIFRDRNQADHPIVTIHLNRSDCSDDDLKELVDLKHLRFLNLTSTKVTDAGLENLAGFTELLRLYLADTSVNGTGFVHLEQCDKIEWLRLANSQFSDVGMEHISRFTNLTQLTLDGTQITDDGLSHLSGLDNLNILQLSRTRISDEGMSHLSTLTKLKNLNLNETQVTDEGLLNLTALTDLTGLSIEDTDVTGSAFDKLQTLSHLRWLSADRTKFSNDGAANLANFPELNEVNIRGTEVSDEGLLHFAKLKNLQYLRLDSSQFSDEAVKKLQQSLPNLIIGRY